MSRLLAVLVAVVTCTPAPAAGLPGRDGRLVVVRGVGFSPWHSTEHWGLSESTRALDRELLRGAHINTLRHWGPGTVEDVAAKLADGFYCIPTIHCNEGLKAQFADGVEKGPAFSDPATRDQFAARVREHAAKFRGHDGPLCFLLGNEYSAVGCHKTIDDYQYTGFEAPTQARFRRWLTDRFDSLEHVNRSCGTQFRTYKDVRPLANRRFRYEWWLFLNRTFERFMRSANDALKAGAPDKQTSYAKLMGTHWDPYTEDALLPFLDIGGGNLYWNWVKDWARYNSFINDLIAAAGGKPVLLTEGGFQSRVLGEEAAGRLTKQMLWNAFLHPQVAGFCVYAYSDEWYVDGNPDEQTDRESWGIVTADRRPKPTYHAVAEVYAIIERLNKFFASCEATPVVGVSNQALGQLVEGKSTALHDDIGRVLYSEGVAFKSVLPVDVYALDPATTPRLIWCDELLDCEPDGSHSGVEPLVAYVRAGGQVLYLCPEPWRVPYGRAQVPRSLRFGLDGRRVARVGYGRGSIRFLPRNQFEPDELRQLIVGFLQQTGAPRPVVVRKVRPGDQRQHCFCRLLRNGQDQILLIVNAADEPLDVVELQVSGAATARLSHGDGARIAHMARQGTRLKLRLRDIDTYALVRVGH